MVGGGWTGQTHFMVGPGRGPTIILCYICSSQFASTLMYFQTAISAFHSNLPGRREYSGRSNNHHQYQCLEASRTGLMQKRVPPTCPAQLCNPCDPATLACRLRETSQAPRQNIAKGTTDPRVEFISEVQTQILTKHQLKNLNQTSAF